jgi:hypothetical protein
VLDFTGEPSFHGEDIRRRPNPPPAPELGRRMSEPRGVGPLA